MFFGAVHWIYHLMLRLESVMTNQHSINIINPNNVINMLEMPD